MFYTIIISIITIICILLTIVVLLQSGQGEGLSGGLAAGGGFGGGPMGARRTADLLSKSTTVLGTAFLVLCVIANFFIDTGQQTQSAVQQSGVEQPVDVNNPSESPSAIPQQPQQQQIPQQPSNNNNSGGGNNNGGGSDNNQN